MFSKKCCTECFGEVAYVTVCEIVSLKNIVQAKEISTMEVCFSPNENDFVF